MASTTSTRVASSSSLVVMEARRGKGLKKNLDSESGKGPGANMMNGGKGQEITGVSLPADGELTNIMKPVLLTAVGTDCAH